MQSGIKLSVSLYSYTQQWVERENFGFKEMLEHLHGLDIHTIEIVGAQMFSEYPIIPENEVTELLKLTKKFNMEIYAYDGYTDQGKYANRDMTRQEMVQEIEYDILSAKRLGCKLLKTHIPLDLLSEVDQLADQYDIKIGIEIHAPELPGNEMTNRYVEAIRSLKIKHIGLVPDFGMFILKPNKALLDKYRDMGINEELLQFVINHRFAGYNEETMWKKVESMGGGENEKFAISEMFGYLSWSEEADFSGLKKILPYCNYFHGKFYNMDASCVESTIPYEELLKIIMESRYDGYIATEYEGHSFMLDDAMEQIERHIKMERAIIENS